MLPKYSGDNFPKVIHVVNELEAIAKKKGCTSSQVTLAWLLAQGNDVIPIPGTRSVKYLEENAGAADVVLSAEEEKEIRSAIEETKIEGARYPDM